MNGRILGIIGAVLTGLSAFAPFYRAPGFGSSALITASPIAGIILIVCAIFGGRYSFKGNHWKVLFISIASMSLAMFGVMSFFGALGSLVSSATGFRLGWLARLYTEHVSLSWGVVVIFFGSGLMFKGAGKMREESKSLKHAVNTEPVCIEP